MKFADFDEHDSAEPWCDIMVRPMAAADIRPVAEIYGERESVGADAAMEIVSRWADDVSECLVLVAEHQGRVEAYAKAEWLSPSGNEGTAPTGWYLTGLVVRSSARRRGVGAALTDERIALLRTKATEVWYFANARNRATIALHERAGFSLHTDEFTLPGVTFEGGQGALFRLGMDHR